MPASRPKQRLKESAPYRTDNGNFIYDCPFGGIIDVPRLATALSVIPGVVDHGLFVGMASVLILAGEKGVRVIEERVMEAACPSCGRTLRLQPGRGMLVLEAAPPAHAGRSGPLPLSRLPRPKAGRGGSRRRAHG